MKQPTLRVQNVEIKGFGHGLYVLRGILLDDHHTNPWLRVGSFVRSSLLVKANFKKGTFETLNTIYQEVMAEPNLAEDLEEWR